MCKRRRIGDLGKIIRILYDLPPVIVSTHDTEHLRTDSAQCLIVNKVIDPDGDQQHQNEPRIDTFDTLAIVGQDAEFTDSISIDRHCQQSRINFENERYLSSLPETCSETCETM